MTFRHPSTRIIAAASTALLVGAGLLFATGASAHIEPTPAAAQAGTTITVEFKVEHGCDGSPTTKLEIKVPSSATDVAPVPKPGWTASHLGEVVSYTGGPLGATTPDTFGLKLTTPKQAGELEFPIVQTCEKGSTSWISSTPPGGPEPENPAPVVEVTAGAPTSSEVAGPHNSDSVGSSTDTSQTHTGPTTNHTKGLVDSGLDTVAGPASAKGDSTSTLIWAGVVSAVVVLAGGLALTRVRNRQK